VIITFSSTGTIDRVYYSCYFASSTGNLATATYTGNPSSPGDMDKPYFFQARPLQGAYFLVGKIEKIQQLNQGPIHTDVTDPKYVPNYQEPNARWVSITRQSGLVTTTEVAALQGAAVVPPNSWAKFPPAGTYPAGVEEWAGVINAVMNSRRYASGNQNSGGI
jgi:hypothetical protein